MTSRQSNTPSPSVGGEEPLAIVRCGTHDIASRLVNVRDELDLSMRDAARALGITTMEWIGVATGVYHFDIAEAERRLRAYAAARKEVT